MDDPQVAGPPLSEVEGTLLDPAAFLGAADILRRPCPLPALPGIYAWWFSELPRGVPIDGCLHAAGRTLLYVGISPKAPPPNGGRPSSQSIRTRLRYHYRGNASGSTLRLTLGCLLSETLGIRLQVVGSGRLTFGSGGESTLSRWMEANAEVSYMLHVQPWVVEHRLIRELSLPLNLDQNRDHPFHPELTALRALARATARAAGPVPESR